MSFSPRLWIRLLFYNIIKPPPNKYSDQIQNVKFSRTIIRARHQLHWQANMSKFIIKYGMII